jgi:hypothetical protein
MGIFSKRTAYRLLKYHGDYNAVRKNKVPRRIARRAYGKITGRVARRLFG